MVSDPVNRKINVGEKQRYIANVKQGLDPSKPKNKEKDEK